MFDAAMKVLNLLNDRHRAATGFFGWVGIQPKALPHWARPEKQSKYMPHQGKQEIARRLKQEGARHDS